MEFPRISGQYLNPEEEVDGCPRRQRPDAFAFSANSSKRIAVSTACRPCVVLLGVAPSGYYAWLAQPVSDRAQEDARLLRLIRPSFTASQGIYDAPRVFLDLREAGEGCSKHRVARLMREHQLGRCMAIGCGAGRSASPRYSFPTS